MTDLERLAARVRHEAEQAEFPVDRPVYEKAGKDPLDPVLYAGNVASLVCVFGRDLGKEEVIHGQPLIGAGGRLVREGVLRAFLPTPDPKDKWLEQALRFVLLTNTVPYKPPGNKAYPERVKERFRPMIAELLEKFWTGRQVITLGTEAFQWFARYAEPGAAEEFWKREDRYEATLPCRITASEGMKTVLVAPLPHPSPLNQRWYKKFPELLDRRLADVS